MGWIGVCAAALAGCGSEIIVNRVDERDANRIIELLENHEIGAMKGMVDTGREQYFTIAVSGGDRVDAIRLLNHYEMPRPAPRGYAQVFAGGGLIPSQSEERAKYMQAIEGEVQKQLLLVPGILDVEVQVNIPEESPLKTIDAMQPATASVTIKYLEGANGEKPLNEPDVQSVVAAGVEKLTKDHVVVAMVPAARPTVRTSATAVSRADVLKDRRVQMGMAAAIVLIVLLGLGLVFFQFRLRAVRGRLVRLQKEIAKARRKGGTDEGGAQAA